MAKGISAVIATIMLLMITVALIGVFYVFSSGLMTSGTSSAGGAATATTDRMLKTIALSGERCYNTSPTNNVITFAIQNVGTKDLLAGELAVYVNDTTTGVTSTPELSAGLSVSAGPTQVATTMTGGRTSTKTLKIIGPSNTEQRSLTC